MKKFLGYLKFFFIFLFFVLIFLFKSSLIFASYTYDKNFPVTNGKINDMLIYNSFLYLGGEFTFIGPLTGSGVIVDLSYGSIIKNIGPIDGSVFIAVSDENGGWYIGGTFNNVGGVSKKRLAHIFSNGTVDNNWNPWGSNQGVTFYAMVKSGDYIYIGGNFTTSSPLGKNYVARINATTGVVDNTWNPNPNNLVKTILINGNDIYLGGSFTNISGQSTIKYLAKVDNNTGTIDSDWNPSVNNTVNSIYYDGNYLYIGGSFTSVGGQSISRLARINISNATVDTGWNPSPNNTVEKVISNGTNIFVAGSFTNIGGQSINYLAKLDNSGNADSSFNPNPNNSLNFDIKLINSYLYYLYVVGNFTNISNTLRNYAAKLNINNGSVDNDWNPSSSNTLRVIQYDGSNIFLGGDMNIIGGIRVNRLARINISNKNLDTSWLPNVDNIIYTLDINDNYIYIGGVFNNVNGSSIAKLARINLVNGQVDSSWTPNPNYQVYKLAAEGGYLYVGGYFTNISNQSLNRLVRFNLSDGSIDSQWLPNPNNTVYTLTFDTDYVYVGGRFTNIGGKSLSYIARVSKNDASGDDNWNPQADYDVYTLSINNNKIYVGGEFESIGGKNYKSIARLSLTTGSADDWFATYQNSYFYPNDIYSFAFDENYVYVGGNFTIYNEDWENLYESFIRVDYNGMIDSNFNWTIYPGSSGSWSINKVLLDNYDVYFAGQFTKTAGEPASNLVRLLYQPETTATPTLTPTPTFTFSQLNIPTITPSPTIKIKSLSLNKEFSATSANSTTVYFCNNSKPSSISDLFQINVNNNKATLFFTPAGHPLNKYAIIYGYDINDERFGIEFDAQEYNGVLSYTINYLQPNTTYYFKIRGGNGCMPGDWSNTMKVITTNSSFKNKIYYKNLITKIINSLFPTKAKSLNRVQNIDKDKNFFTNVCEYNVKAGDTLWDIAYKYYKSGFKYKEIMNKNKLNSKIIKPGQKLKIDCAN